MGSLFGVLCGAITFVWFEATAQPDLKPPPLTDNERPLDVPFQMSNGHFWYTMRSVHPICKVSNFRTVDNAGIEGCPMEDEADIGDIRPGKDASFPCAVVTMFDFAKLVSADLEFTAGYGVRWLPGWEPRYERKWEFDLRRTRSGAAYWTAPPLRDSR